jgi:hypothetical protein
MEALSDFLFDPRRLADIGLTEDELLADLMWPAPVAARSADGKARSPRPRSPQPRRAEGKS